MRIESVDFFYLAMPEITMAVDGSQDALVVRVTAGDYVGWGECEASPLVSMAAFVTPASHGACRPVSDAVLGETLDSPADIARISALVKRQSMDLLQAMHTYSGVEMALWDLLGKRFDQPVWKLLGYDRAYSKLPYASILFGATPEETYNKVGMEVERGFRAVKLGWNGFGETTAAADELQLAAAREALGPDRRLLVDAGQIWGDDVDVASSRLAALREHRVTWLEEPFSADEYHAYRELAARAGTDVGIAGGEASHNSAMAINLIKYGGVRFVQIDCGRIGGLLEAKRVADYAADTGVAYVNHTFTSHLALSASLQPFAGLRDSEICEYPSQPSALAKAITAQEITIGDDGRLAIPDTPGLGIDVSLDALRDYIVPVEITVGGRTLLESTRDLSLAKTEH